jgi:hypothetical protein
MSKDETIRVVIRCKGKESLNEAEIAKWTCTATEVALPEKTFTFDHILVDQDQETMYNTSA